MTLLQAESVLLSGVKKLKADKPNKLLVMGNKADVMLQMEEANERYEISRCSAALPTLEPTRALAEWQKRPPPPKRAP